MQAENTTVVFLQRPMCPTGPSRSAVDWGAPAAYVRPPLQKEKAVEVTYLDHMGSDLSVVNAARVSFGKKVQ